MADRYDYERGYESERDRSGRPREDYGRERNRPRDDDRWRSGRGEDRGFVDRASDEVRSWFGDEEASRRRQRDEMRDYRDEQRRDDYRRGRESEYRESYGTERGYAAGEDIGRPRRSPSVSDWSSASPRDVGRGERGPYQPSGRSGSSEREQARHRGEGGELSRERDDRLAPMTYSYSMFAWIEPGPLTGLGPRGYTRSDDRIREDICDRLTRHGRIDATDVQINVRNGEVTLEGRVDSRDAKRLAEDVAESVDGVRDVINHLKANRGADETTSRMFEGSRSSHTGPDRESTGSTPGEKGGTVEKNR